MLMTDVFELGELVTLWSGGPQMRILRTDDKLAVCERLEDGVRDEIPLEWLRRMGDQVSF